MIRTIRVECAACHEVIGIARDEDGYDAQWWADKMILEHLDEYHD